MNIRGMFKRNFLCFIIAAIFVAPIMAMENNDCRCGKEIAASDFHFAVMEEVPSFDPAKASPKPSIGDLPAYFSWLDYGGNDWTTPARFQGMCGSCWAFAAVGALESIINIREGIAELDPDLSEQYILSCLPESGSCRGGSPYLAFQYIKSTGSDGNYHNGIIPEDCMPYQADDSIPCDEKCDDWENKLVPITDYGYWLPDGSDEDRKRIKTQIMEEGPVVSFMMATEDFMQWGLEHHSPSDYYPYPGYVEGINHCILIVGWKDDPSIPRGGYWICKNSWGSFWGYNGFFNIEYGSLHVDDYSIVWVDYDKNAYDWPPVAEAGGPYIASVGEEITFDGSKSMDDEGSIVAWHWDFGDGATSDETTPKHSYNQRGIYDVTLTVEDSSGQESVAETAALIDAWKESDEWTFDISKIEIGMEYGGQLNFSGNIEELNFKVTNDIGNYIVEFSGRLNGDFSYYSQPPLQLTGKFLLTKINGELTVTKEFAIDGIEVEVRGLTIIKLEIIPIPLPIPFKVTASITFSGPYTLIDFPLKEKIWNLPLTNVSIDALATALFGIVKVPLQINIPLGSMEVVCSGKQSISTPAGSFEAYKMSIYDIIELYYSPDIANFVKASVKYEGIDIEAELVDVNYE